LIDQHPRHFKNNNVQARFLEVMSYEYEQCLLQVIADGISACGIEKYDVEPWKIGMTKMNFIHNKQRADIFSFATRNHITHKTYGYHQIPSLDYVRRLIELKFKLFFIIRDPLDMILSIIKKSPDFDMNKNNISDERFSSISKLCIKQLKLWSC